MGVDLIPAAQAGTLYGLLCKRTERMPDAVAYREVDRTSGEWVALTWREVLARVDRIAGALAATGVGRGDRVAIFLQNCADWICYDMAAHKLGLPVVPLYTNDAVANTAYVLSDARPRVLLLDTAARWEAVATALEDTSFIEAVWIHDAGATDEGMEALPGNCSPWSTVIEAASGFGTEACSTPDDPAALIYTSGTTGAPKGAVLTHRALLANAEGVAQVFPPRTDDTFLSVLPLAHGFERTMGYVLPLLGGSCVAYAQSVLRLRQDLATIRPTALMGVPRLYESIYSSARRAAAESPLRLRLFDMTARIGWQRFAARGGLGPGPGVLERMIWPLLDRLVARKVKAAFGGNLRVAVSGGASFPPEISRALIGLGVPMVEGYGLTEAGPVVTASLQEEYVPGSVGYALPGIEIACTDAGELEIRSPGCMTGYWRNPEATANLIDSKGWMQTGDLAQLDGRWIRITGRLKHILVLSNGENVNPRPIETALESDPLFEQICVAGDGRPYLTVLLVLNKDVWQEVAGAAGVDAGDPNSREARALIQPRIKDRLAGFPSYQQVRGYHASLDEWTVQQRLVTPTLKLRRDRILAAYGDEIAALYTREGGSG
ncbi:AMP-dependent synthetase/ligase [Tropicimonas marinistellae]|uniref:AMP-dependent synthetase/ligase n=1 Tax=Tropicimonas marinistellae TaxID=1739787 RepID=UPI0008332D23|nr:long-chain fatty acid--CoA ligase [Tropicimonas marinistellae]